MSIHPQKPLIPDHPLHPETKITVHPPFPIPSTLTITNLSQIAKIKINKHIQQINIK